MSNVPAEMDDWKPVSTAPEGVWLRTRRDGEEGENVTALLVCDEGDREWIDREGRTTITHHSFAPPTHWRPL